MKKPDPKQLNREAAHQRPLQDNEDTELAEWETPTMEDVSEQVMAQPYIRFT